MSQANYIDQFKIIREISSGFTAVVYLAQFQNKYYAIKKFSQSKTAFAKEQFQYSKDLNHKNIIRYYQHRTFSLHSNQNDLQICQVIIMEYAQNGELFQLISKFGRFQQSLARTYFHMLIEAIQSIHLQNILHLDIKLQNILLDKSFQIKLADFGFATENENQVNKIVGTEGYMAPEIHQQQGYDGQKVDLFACGVCLFILVVGSPPFVNTSDSDKYFFNLNQNQTKFWKPYAALQLSEQFKDLVVKMLRKNPLDRPTISQIKRHKWYNRDIMMGNDVIKKMKALTTQ